MENHKSKEYSKHVINSINNITPNVKPKLKIKIHNKTKPLLLPKKFITKQNFSKPQPSQIKALPKNGMSSPPKHVSKLSNISSVSYSTPKIQKHITRDLIECYNVPSHPNINNRNKPKRTLTPNLSLIKQRISTPSSSSKNFIGSNSSYNYHNSNQNNNNNSNCHNNSFHQKFSCQKNELLIILSLKKQLKLQNEQLKMKTAEIERLKQENIIANYNELLIENNVLNRQMVKMKNEIEKIDENLEKYNEERVNKLKNEINELKQKIESVNEKYQIELNKNENLQNSIAVVNEENIQKEKEFEQKISELQIQNDDYESQRGVLMLQIENMQNENNEIKNSLNDIKQKYDKVLSQKDLLQKEIETYNSNLIQKENELFLVNEKYMKVESILNYLNNNSNNILSNEEYQYIQQMLNFIINVMGKEVDINHLQNLFLCENEYNYSEICKEICELFSIDINCKDSMSLIERLIIHECHNKNNQQNDFWETLSSLKSNLISDVDSELSLSPNLIEKGNDIYHLLTVIDNDNSDVIPINTLKRIIKGNLGNDDDFNNIMIHLFRNQKENFSLINVNYKLLETLLNAQKENNNETSNNEIKTYEIEQVDLFTYENTKVQHPNEDNNNEITSAIIEENENKEEIFPYELKDNICSYCQKKSISPITLFSLIDIGNGFVNVSKLEMFLYEIQLVDKRIKINSPPFNVKYFDEQLSSFNYELFIQDNIELDVKNEVNVNTNVITNNSLGEQQPPSETNSNREMITKNFVEDLFENASKKVDNELSDSERKYGIDVEKDEINLKAQNFVDDVFAIIIKAEQE